MSRTLVASLLLSTSLGFALGCASNEPEVKKAPPSDEFQGFGALRGEPRKKKEAAPAQEEEAAAGQQGEGEAAAGGGGGGGKTALTKEQVVGAIDTAQKRVAACLQKHKDPGIYVMEITIAPDGSCTVNPVRAPTRKEEPELWADVEAGLDGGKNPKSPTNKCLAGALTKVKFPTFDGKPLVVTYPLLLK